MKRDVTSYEYKDQRHITLRINWVVGSFINQDNALGKKADLEKKEYWLS